MAYAHFRVGGGGELPPRNGKCARVPSVHTSVSLPTPQPCEHVLGWLVAAESCTGSRKRLSLRGSSAPQNDVVTSRPCRPRHACDGVAVVCASIHTRDRREEPRHCAHE